MSIQIPPDDVPLVYTIKGNLPIASLDYRTVWELRTDPADPSRPLTMAFIEEYALEGEVVKRSVHIYDFQGTAGAGEVASIN